MLSPDSTGVGAISGPELQDRDADFPLYMGAYSVSLPAAAKEVAGGANRTVNYTRAAIIGPDSICSEDRAATYRIELDAGATLPVSLHFDSRFVQEVFQVLPSPSYIIRFKNWGTTTLSVQIVDGSSVVTVSKEVTIPRPAASLNLGADTALCTGVRLPLHAGGGFVSYRWHDGTTDSVFTVSHPGIYYVDVTDACGDTKRDSMVVQWQPPLPLQVGGNRTRCDNDSLTLSAPAGFLRYEWTPVYRISATNRADVLVYPDMDTVYSLKVETAPGCFSFDTARVSVLPSLKIDLGANRQFCTGDSVLLDAGSGFQSYLWNNEAGGQQKTVHAKGTYVVVATAPWGCRSTDTVDVLTPWPLPVVGLEKDPVLCAGGTKILQAGNFSSYLWQDGSTQSHFAATTPGTYYVRVIDNRGCTGSDTTKIRRVVPPPANFLPADTTICAEDGFTIQSTQPYLAYAWSNGSTGSSLTVRSPGSYRLQVQDGNGCFGRDTIVLTAKQCVFGIHIPTAFTPNRDGKNDLFRALVYEKLQKFELTVFNRWGERVFRSTDPLKGWDGSRGSSPLEAGVYAWTCRFTLNTGEKGQLKGTVTLVR